MSDLGLHVRLLGPVDVSRDGAPVPLPRSRKVRALLAFLALGARLPCHVRGCATCSGTSRTIRAASCAGA